MFRLREIQRVCFILSPVAITSGRVGEHDGTQRESDLSTGIISEGMAVDSSSIPKVLDAGMRLKNKLFLQVAPSRMKLLAANVKI